MNAFVLAWIVTYLLHSTILVLGASAVGTLAGIFY